MTATVTLDYARDVKGFKTVIVVGTRGLSVDQLQAFDRYLKPIADARQQNGLTSFDVESALRAAGLDAQVRFREESIERRSMPR